MTVRHRKWYQRQRKLEEKGLLMLVLDHISLSSYSLILESFVLLSGYRDVLWLSRAAQIFEIIPAQAKERLDMKVIR